MLPILEIVFVCSANDIRQIVKMVQKPINSETLNRKRQEIQIHSGEYKKKRSHFANNTGTHTHTEYG